MSSREAQLIEAWRLAVESADLAGQAVDDARIVAAAAEDRKFHAKNALLASLGDRIVVCGRQMYRAADLDVEAFDVEIIDE